MKKPFCLFYAAKKLFFYSLALISVMLFSAFALHASQASEYQAELSNLVNAQWQNYMSKNPNIQGGLALYIISPKGNFYASSNMPGGTAATHFRTGSVSKTYTAAAIMLLAQAGKIHIDDVITSSAPLGGFYLPQTSTYTNIPYASSMTIRMLLEHRAGLFDTTNAVIPSTAPAPYRGQDYFAYVAASSPTHTFTFDEIINVISTNSLSSFPPGTQYSYSNTGYILLGKIVEWVSGVSYGQYIKDNFLTPNHLSNTTLPFLGTDQDIPAPYETGYMYYGTTSARDTELNVSNAVAAGAVITTPGDLANWIRDLIGGTSGLTPYTVSLMTSPIQSPDFYGLGLMGFGSIGIGHAGKIGGYFTDAFYDSQHDLSMVISAAVLDNNPNSAENDTMAAIALGARKILGYSSTSGAAANLSAVKAYPNPFNSKTQKLTITNLTAGATVKIYDVAGRMIRSLSYTTANGQVLWDGKNDGGSLAASGVYIVYIDSPAGSKKIKVAIQK